MLYLSNSAPLRQCLDGTLHLDSGRCCLDLGQIGSGEFEVGGGEVLLDLLSLRVPGIGTIHGCWANTDANATWAGVAPSRPAIRARAPTTWFASASVANLGMALRKSWASTIMVLIVPVRNPLPAAERDKPDAEFSKCRDDLGLRGPPPQRVFGLQRGDGLHGVGHGGSCGAPPPTSRSGRPSCRFRSRTAPAVSSMGTSGSTRCW